MTFVQRNKLYIWNLKTNQSKVETVEVGNTSFTKREREHKLGSPETSRGKDIPASVI